METTPPRQPCGVSKTVLAIPAEDKHALSQRVNRAMDRPRSNRHPRLRRRCSRTLVVSALDQPAPIVMLCRRERRSCSSAGRGPLGSGAASIRTVHARACGCQYTARHVRTEMISTPGQRRLPARHVHPDRGCKPYSRPVLKLYGSHGMCAHQNNPNGFDAAAVRPSRVEWAWGGGRVWLESALSPLAALPSPVHTQLGSGQSTLVYRWTGAPKVAETAPPMTRRRSPSPPGASQ